MKKQLIYIILAMVIGCMPQLAAAHQTPTTIVLLDVSPGKVAAELQLPLSELELAFDHDITKDPSTLVQQLGPQLKEYLKAHIHPYVNRENPWAVEIKTMQVTKGEQAVSGPPYWELVVQLEMIPPGNVSTRNFTFDYDVIIHQVNNHAAFVSVRNDWASGKTGEQATDAGVIKWDTKDNVIHPLQINLEEGNWWKGFKSMLALGMQHIKEGTDHLLFLLTLLLPAMLLAKGNRWGGFGGTKYSVVRLLKITTAFTIGHSLTLLAGAMGWFRLPAQPVEILIAFSILISSIHAVYPLFPGKEMYVAAGFGLIHGLAFASVIADLNLNGAAMALSIAGFNIGIELMQLFVIALIVPWLILLSQTRFYTGLRITGAVLSGIAALAWIAERSSGKPNFISTGVQNLSQYAVWCIAALALLSILLFASKKRKQTAY
ncbi:HupE/UreJ family protein [Ferruginibacter sp.]